MTFRTRTLVPVSLLLAGLALAAGCDGANAQKNGRLSGHVEATEVRLATKIAGRLVKLAVREGDAVTVGQTIAQIDTTDVELALATSRADRDAAKAELALRENGARREDVAEARANVQNLEADLAGAQRELDRMQGLLDSGSGTGKARDDAQTRRDISAARLAAARQSLARLERGFRAEEIAAARARVAAAEARIAQLEQQVKDATVTSPAAGVVSAKAAEQGELLGVGTPLVTITELGDAWLTVFVGEPDLGRVHLGQAVTVTTDGGQSRSGKITFIASTAEFTPKNVQTKDERVKLVYRIKVGLPNGDGLFKPGMPAEAAL
jgi:HlyD family secretion protein